MSTDPPVRLTPYGAPQRRPTSPWRRARAGIREQIRSWGRATASLRARPDYLVIGTKRGGTTSLARWLIDHPHVAPLFPARETRKGTYYFDVNYHRGEDWYRSHFPTRAALALRSRAAGRRILVGEATPYYLAHPHAPVRARRYAPDARIVVLLRNPVDRAFSHWQERVRNQVESLDFAAAIAAEPARLAGEYERMLADPAYVSFAHQHHGYLAQSDYAEGLSRWLDLWPPSQLLIRRSEDLYADPAKLYTEVTDFLGLDPILPEFRVFNRRPGVEFDPDLRAELEDRLAPSVAKLEGVLGRSMDWW